MSIVTLLNGVADLSKKLSVFMSMVLLLSLTLTACSSEPVRLPSILDNKPTIEDRELVILTWENYIKPEVVTAFEEEMGIKVEQVYFDKNEDMIAMLEEPHKTRYDLVIGSDYAIEIVLKQGLAQKLDKESIANFRFIDAHFQGHFYDPQDEYTIPYGAGTPLIVYDPAAVGPIRGYADLWLPELEDSLVVFDDARLMMGFTMKALGGSLNSTDPEFIALAESKLMELKPNIHLFDYNYGDQAMINSGAKAGLLFTPHMVRTLNMHPEYEVVYPIEGLGFGIDCFFVAKEALHPQAAHIFLDYILRGEVSAQLSEHNMYINCVSTAKSFVSPTSITNRYLYIPSFILGEVEFIKDIGSEATALIDAAWQRFKNIP